MKRSTWRETVTAEGDNGAGVGAEAGEEADGAEAGEEADGAEAGEEADGA